jgi:hypothetical protein
VLALPGVEQLLHVPPLLVAELEAGEKAPSLGDVVILDGGFEMLAYRNRLPQLPAQPTEKAHLRRFHAASVAPLWGLGAQGPTGMALSRLVRDFAIRIEPVGSRADLRGHLARLLSLLRVLLCDLFAFLGLPGMRHRLLPKLLRLLAPLLQPSLPISHHRERDRQENDHRTDRYHDPNPTCHSASPPSLVCSEEQTAGIGDRFRCSRESLDPLGHSFLNFVVRGVASVAHGNRDGIADRPPNSGAGGLAREANAHILALEARVREMGLRSRVPDEDLIGLFCECGCMSIVSATREDYERDGGVWLEGHEPGLRDG